MTQLFANNAVSTLAAAIASGATALSVQPGHGARFPQPAAGDYFLVTLFQMIAGVESNYEIVKVTARSVDTFTIVRSQEGTAPRAYGAGDQISMRSSAGTLAGMAQLGAPATFTQPVNVPTAAAGTNTTQAASTAFVTGAVAQAKADLVASSPAALDTLSELAAALGNDANFATTITTSLGNRLRVDTNTQGLTAQQKANAVTNLGLAAVAVSGAKADIGLANAENKSSAMIRGEIVKADVTTGLGYTPAAVAAFPTGNASSVLAEPNAVRGISNPATGLGYAGGVRFRYGYVNDVDSTADSADIMDLSTFVDANGGGVNSLYLLKHSQHIVHKWAAAGATAWTVQTLAYLSDLSAYAPLAAPAFTGIPTVPTATAGTNTTQIANTAFVAAAVANLVASSPAALDTLNELATALGNDPAFAATTAAAMGNRLRVDAAQGLTAPQQAQGRANLALDQVSNTSDANKPVSTAQQTALNAKQDASAKDATGGFAGLTGFAINLKNAAGSILSSIVSAATAARTYTFPDKSITVAGTTNETHVTPTIKGYTEQLQTVAGGSAVTLDPTQGTLIVVNVTAATTITLPAAAAGLGYTVILNYQGAFAATFAGGTAIKWAGGAAPTATSVSGKMDKYIFACTGAATLGQDGGRNF